jgi:hypothetical protein
VEIINIARGHIVLRDGSKSTTIYGEALLRGYKSPDFILYSSSIERWDMPDESEKICEEKKKEMIDFIKEEFARRSMTVEIE